jgi:hypothetical protein
MKWIDDKVASDERFNEDKNNLKNRIVQWIKRHEFNQRDGYEPQMTIKKFFDAYSGGRIREGYGDALDSFLTSTDEYAKFTYDPEYRKILESLKRLHDSYIGRRIGEYEKASKEELQAQKDQEIDMYMEILGEILTVKVTNEGLPNYSLDSAIDNSIITKNNAIIVEDINKGIPGDKLYYFASIVTEKYKEGFPSKWYEEFVNKIKDRLEKLKSMTPEQYKEAKKDYYKIKMIGFNQ